MKSIVIGTKLCLNFMSMVTEEGKIQARSIFLSQILLQYSSSFLTDTGKMHL